MVLHVEHVVVDQETKSERRIGADLANGFEGGVGDPIDEVDEEEIVLVPEGDEGRPGELLVGVQADPIVLRVAGALVRAVEGGADEALVVVGGGIDEVAEFLFGVPGAGSRGGARRGGFVDGGEDGEFASDRVAQVLCEFGCHGPS